MSSTQPGWKTIKNQLEIVQRDPKDLIPYPRNAKLHPKEQIQEIANSIQEFGFNDPVAIDENGEIIEGEGRYHASLLLGLKSIPTIQLLGLSEEQKIAYRLAHNNLNIKTGLDDLLVKADLDILKELNYDLKLTGFDKGDLSKLLGENFNLDNILSVPTPEPTKEEKPPERVEPERIEPVSNNTRTEVKDSLAREIDVDAFEFDCECPKCGFMFNKK
jgi:ParB-like chromosome segregation protein Spo0J